MSLLNGRPCWSAGLLGLACMLSVTACHRQSKPAEEDPFLSVSNPEQAIKTYKAKVTRNPEDANAWRELGQAYLGMNQYALAAEALQRSSSLEPSRGETWALLGLAFSKQKAWDEAATAYGQALDRAPQSTEYLARYRELMEGRGRHRELVAKVVDRIAKGPEGVKLLNTLARDYLRAGAVSAAEDAAQASLNLKEDQPETWVMLARALERQERWNDASSAWQGLLKLQPNRADGLVGLGRAYGGMGDQKKAEENFQAALRQDSKNVEALQGLIELYLNSEDFSRASSLLRDALNLAPEAPALQVAQAELYLKQGHADQALTLLKLAVVQAPDDFRLNRVLGEALLQTGQAEKAIPVLEKADKLAPGDLHTRRLLCKALLEAGKTAQVAALCKDVEAPEGTSSVRAVDKPVAKAKPYKKAPKSKVRGLKGDTGASGNARQGVAQLPAALRPSSLPGAGSNVDKAGARSAFMTGQTYFRNGEYPSAAEAFRKAMQLDPTNPNYPYNLGVTYAVMYEYDMASEAFKQCLSLNPRDVDALYNLATTLFRLGQYAEAVIAYQQVLKVKPNDQEAYKGMGAAYEAMGQLSKAQECYRLGGGQPAMEEVE